MDTSAEVDRLQAEILRRMTGQERLKIALDLSDTLRSLTLTRLRAEHPDWTHRELMIELLRLALHPEPLPPALRTRQSKSKPAPNPQASR